MNITRNRVVFLLCECLGGYTGYAQKADPVAPDTIKTYQDAEVTSRVRDSMEVALLRTSLTYQHVERLIRALPAESIYLDLLPSVLPVDVPIEAFRITSAFGMRSHPIRKQMRLHAGVDVRASVGLPVKATAAGFVSQVGNDPMLGVFVRLQHAFGFETLYGHLSGYCVKLGQIVARSEEIGRVGKTGQATGPHLHYTIKKNGSVVDPFEFCFLLRRRLWLYQSASPMASGSSVSDSTNCVSKGR